MKNFPRLYSLSTLGIRQHQEFDYRFHGFRTDFVGDSGSGKSMIADLVQLVFVGSEHFHSATESMDKREVDGMVLKSAQGRGTDMAYILVNVEVAADRYVVIGAYLESSSRQTKSFIIQADWDEEALKPLIRPITVEDISVDEQIPTLEWFKEAMEQQGFVYHHFPQRKKFHSYLYKHKLLSIDLSQSNQVLKDYALIIQSFARGKSLDIGNSTSLKSFLFGDEKAKEITWKYKKAVEELQTTLKEYSQNRQEIELVKKKHQMLKVLRGFKETLDVAEKNMWTKLCAYTCQQEKEGYESFRESGKDYCDGVFALTAVRQVLRDELASELEVRENLDSLEKSAQEFYNAKFSDYSKLEPFIKLLAAYDCTPDELGEIYRNYHLDKDRFELIERVKGDLKRENLTEILNSFLSLGEITKIIVKIDKEIDDRNIQKKQKDDLIAFADINNKGSLGNWAIRNYQSYSKEVESILMFYKNLSVEKPLDGKRQYILKPENLLLESTIVERQTAGFWITTGEIYQYVPYVEKQLFTAENSEQLKLLLENVSQDLKREIVELVKEVTNLMAFKNFILKNKDFSDFLVVYHYAEELNNFQPQSKFEISKFDFGEGMKLLESREQIESDFNSANKGWKAAREALTDYKRLISSVKKANDQLNTKLEGNKSRLVLETLFNSFPEFRVDELIEHQQMINCKTQYNRSSDKDNWISKVVWDNINKINSLDINKQLEEYEELKKSKADAFKEAKYLFGHEPDISYWSSVILDRPVEEEKHYSSSKLLYENKFSDIVTEYAQGEVYKFEDNYNYLELCAAILPDAFLEEQIEKDTSIEIIEQYLSRINEKNKNLNTRKLQKIREILDEVGDEISKRLDTVRQIHNFLNHEEREITGGHRVTLRSEANTGYPKAWIDAYIDKLEQENTLFSVGETLNELLKDSVSLEEKMINAFHAFGGHKGVKPKIEDLLNPNSYFTLTFRMESHATGKNNSGSTGQTYAAIALLCIARLSLVNKGAFNKKPPEGIRFMPVDEAEGLGSNFDMLYEIAREFDYQILTMAINPLGKFREGEQYIYMLSNNKEVPEDVNYPPFGIFSDLDQNFKILGN